MEWNGGMERWNSGTTTPTGSWSKCACAVFLLSTFSCALKRRVVELCIFSLRLFLASSWHTLGKEQLIVQFFWTLRHLHLSKFKLDSDLSKLLAAIICDYLESATLTWLDKPSYVYNIWIALAYLFIIIFWHTDCGYGCDCVLI